MRNHYRYINVRGGIEIVASDAQSGSITIPMIYEGNPVVGIGDGVFRDCVDITEVIIPSGICWIGSRDFAGCSNLSGIELPDTLIWIEEEAFQGCKALRNVCFPEKLNILYFKRLPIGGKEVLSEKRRFTQHCNHRPR